MYKENPLAAGPTVTRGFPLSITPIYLSNSSIVLKNREM